MNVFNWFKKKNKVVSKKPSYSTIRTHKINSEVIDVETLADCVVQVVDKNTTTNTIHNRAYDSVPSTIISSSDTSYGSSSSCDSSYSSSCD